MHCSNCGAPLEKFAPSCLYCGSEHKIEPDDIVFMKKSERDCPRCYIKLDTIRIPSEIPIYIERCRDCKGVFFDPLELDELIFFSKEDNNKSKSKAIKSLTNLFTEEGKSEATDVKNIKCPACKCFMVRNTYETHYGIIIDSCQDGIWIDGGELKKIIRWIKFSSSIKKEETIESQIFHTLHPAWHVQTSITGNNFHLRGVYFTDINTGWIVGDFGKVIHTKNGGISWCEQDSKTTYNLNKVQFLDEKNGYTIGTSPFTGSAIFFTTDGGNIWSYKRTERIYGFYFLDRFNGWLCGYNGNILYTRDGGKTLEKRPSGTSANINAIYFSNLNTGWAVGGGAICNGTVINTGNKGYNWWEQKSISMVELNSLYFTDDKKGWVAGYKGTILHTSDGGNNWNRQPTGIEENLNSIYFSDPCHGWAVGNKGKILYTKDGGITWESQMILTEKDLYGIYFIDKNHAWAVGANGTILKYTI